ncbi:GPI mannosyltransferase 2 [Condylostylus longicornis]|uniref:GPI mannosyltransferase 2 n=1 Tax=Condylostylus longicornis TaxID=2530218 RepID=UPI00244DB670|nr:GPI mannosyltransferase 2 [Condylostylus longicornis]
MANGKVSKLAISSRIIVICLQFIANVLIPDHNPDVFKSPKTLSSTPFIIDKLSEFLFGGFRRWDAEYFLHIAEYGYTYENNLAFYPLYPIIIHYCTKIALAMTFYTCSFRAASLVVSILLNVYFFHRGANCLYELTQRIFGDPNKSWMAVVLFCFNPASIFFSAPYSESLYCWLSFSLMLSCVNHLPFYKTTAALGLSILCRSNGFLNIGYPVYFTFRKIYLKKNFWDLFKLVAILGLALIPLSIFNFFMFQNFCLQSSDVQHSHFIIEYAKQRNYVLAGPRISSNSPWCDENIPFPYSYVQNHYWDLGFLKYYKFRQIPNFSLAFPILLFLFTNIFRCMKKLYSHFNINGFSSTLKEWKSLPFILHCLILVIFCTLFVYIQVCTRLLASANPCLFWFAADCLPKTFDQINFKRKYSLLLYWFGGYFLIGTTLFCNFYPWT